MTTSVRIGQKCYSQREFFFSLVNFQYADPTHVQVVDIFYSFLKFVRFYFRFTVVSYLEDE